MRLIVFDCACGCLFVCRCVCVYVCVMGCLFGYLVGRFAGWLVVCAGVVVGAFVELCTFVWLIVRALAV